MTPLQAQHLAVCHFATGLMASRGKIYAPLFVMRKDGKFKLIQAPWGSQAEKEREVGKMRATLDRDRIDAYSFVTEAWMARFDPRTNPELMDVPVREQSHRKDILLVISQHRDGAQCSTVWDVDYRFDGNVTLGPPEDGGFMGGFMGNLYEGEPLCNA
jgi:hypothetical protein